MRQAPLAERIWRYVDTGDITGCWPWCGTISQQGYGQIYMGGKPKRRAAHRAMYELLVGPVPDGLDLDHLCRNRRCVNPAHLEPVTRSENMRRGALPVVNRLRWSSRETCKNGHPFTAENIHITPIGARVCRVCSRERAARIRGPRVEQTHCVHGHPFDEANTRWSIDGRGRRHRVCRTCHRERERARKRHRNDATLGAS